MMNWSRWRNRWLVPMPDTRPIPHSVDLTEFPYPGLSFRNAPPRERRREAATISLLDELVASNPEQTARVNIEWFGREGHAPGLHMSNDDDLPGGALPRRVQIRATIGYTFVHRFTTLKAGWAVAEADFDSQTMIGLKSYSALVGTAAGTRATLDRFRLFRHLGARRIVGMAGAADGGYVWARFGFRTGSKGSAAIQRHAKQQLEGGIAKGVVSATQQRAIRALIQEGGSDLPFKLAAVPGTIGDKSLGRILLDGARWLGEFDFGCPEAWARAEAYAGRRRVRRGGGNVV